MSISRKLHEECGVAAIIGHQEASYLIYLCLYALQHRGQEGCGIVSIANHEFHSKRSHGLVSESFQSQDFGGLPGDQAIGHVRYSTQGGSSLNNIQPFSFNSSLGKMAIAHNGNLTNAASMKKDLESSGSIFSSSVDSEIFMHLLAKATGNHFIDRMKHAMESVDGAYALAVMTEDALYGVRDPFGFRPLVIGKKDEAYILVSESCALDLIEADYVRDVEPGETVVLRPGSPIESHYLVPKKQASYCAFEPIYFARPDSKIHDEDIYSLRRNMGEQLAEESAVEADTVFAVPDSGVPMAIGYGAKLNIPVELGLVRNHYVGRTFIQPNQEIRDFGVRLKLNPVSSVIKGKKIVVVDDSLVRGTTAKKIVRLLRQAGASEIHLRIGSPPITHSCFYGVDTPSREKLLAAQKKIEEIKQQLAVDSLAFLSVDGLKKALSSKQGYCLACFTGKYPEKIHHDIPKQPTDK